MSGRATMSWQTSLADLSLILFMVTAAAVSTDTKAPAMPADVKPASPQPPGEGLSVYLAQPGMPPFAEWLAAQTPDPRQQLTITATYAREDTRSAVMARALSLADEAGAQGLSARIVVEPLGSASGATSLRAVLAFDRSGAP